MRKYPLLTLGVAALAAIATFGATGVHAQDFPTKALNITVPNPPGGMNQLHAQPLSTVLERITGQPAPVVNRPGAVAAAGTAYVANQPPDGHSLLVTTANLHLAIEKDKLYGAKTPYSLNQIAFIALMSSDPIIGGVHPVLPVKTVKELIALAKAKPNELVYSTSGPYGIFFQTSPIGAEIVTLALKSASLDLLFMLMKSHALSTPCGGGARRLARRLMSNPPANENAVIKTSYGEITLAFWSDVAPKTVENFKKLAREGFYDGTAFHRIIKGFMIQGGCPNTKEGARGMPGTGGPGYTIKAEFNAKPHVRGVISMARSANPDSAGCQFFICHGDARFLDRQYTAFGQLVKGDDVLEKLANVPTKASGGEKSTPIDRVAIESIRIVPAA